VLLVNVISETGPGLQQTDPLLIIAPLKSRI
jgi:hypothetical protein